MADEEAEHDRSAQSASSAAIVALGEKLQELAAALKSSPQTPAQSAAQYCQEFCQTLLEYAGRWRIEEDPLPLVEVYTVALLGYARAAPFLSVQCEKVPLVLERLTLSCVELLLSLPQQLPPTLWKEVQASVQMADRLLQDTAGAPQLRMLFVVVQEDGPWANGTLQSILSKKPTESAKVDEFLASEGPVLLEMRTKQLIKEKRMEHAALLAGACAEHPAFEGKGHFKQTHLVCLCAVSTQEQLMQELSKVDCSDALEMICNLESEGDEKAALSLCSAFLTRQLLQGDMYCAWELTLFWSKLLKRLESSPQTFLDKCRQMSLLSKTVYHILFLIKVIQSELEDMGLPVCVEMCIRALQMESGESGNTKATICKTISCLLPNDLEVKRACQLTEFLLEPTVDSYYAVETLYNEPDQKFEEENLPVPNSLRCELLLVFKTQWPFDPEFWDWKTLKRHCLDLMGEEASIVSSIDELNDSENQDGLDDDDIGKGQELKDQLECFWDTTAELNEITDERRKKREIKKLREKGFISARFRNWQAYMQYCVLCDKEFLGHRIVRHAQTHVKDGMYGCPICAETFDSKDVLVPHVTSHVKQSCKERLAAMKTSKKLANASKAAAACSTPQKDRQAENPACKLKPKAALDGLSSHSDIADTSAVLNKDELSALRAEYMEEYTCPVANCRKGFKYFRNLMAHVKAHKNNEEAKRFLEMQSKKVVCQYCRRQFVSVAHLNDHLQVHCGVRPYICIQLNCKASFLSNAELLVHRKEHAVFKAKCMFPNCGRVFYEAYMLYDHEAQHYKTFTCKEPSCGKLFHSQAQLDLHLEDHVVKEEEPPAEGHVPLADLAEPAPQTFENQPTHSVSDQQPDHSVNVKVLDDQAAFLQMQSGQDVLSAVEESSLCPAGPVKVKHSVESMLNAGTGVTSTQVSECAESLENELTSPEQQQSSSASSGTAAISDSVAVSDAGLSEMNKPGSGETSGLPCQHDPGQMIPQVQLPVPCQASLQNSNSTTQLDILQGGTQCLPCHSQDSLQKELDNVKVEGSSICTGQIPAQHPRLFVNQNLVAPEQVQHCTSAVMQGVHQSALVQTGAPQTAPLPMYGVGTSNTVCQSTYTSGSTAPAGGTQPKERHNCAFETCTRNYSSYRSVTKHMKAAHPEFYVEWKLAKKNNRVTKTPIRTVPTVSQLNAAAASQDRRIGSVPVPVPIVQMQSSTSQPLPFSAGCANPAVTSASFPSHSGISTSQPLTNQMENILNPVLLSQLGNSQSQAGSLQPHIGPSTAWPSQPGSNASLSTQVVCPSHSLTPHMHGVPAPPYPSQMKASNISHQSTEMVQPTLQTSHVVTSGNPFLQPQVDSSISLPGSSSGESLRTPCISTYTTNVNTNELAQVNMGSQGFSHTSQMLPPDPEGLTDPLLTSGMESIPHSVLPSYLESIKDPVLPDQADSSSSPLYPAQIQNATFSNFNPAERLPSAPVQNNVHPEFPVQGNSTVQAATEAGRTDNRNTLVPNGETLTVKRTKRNKRAKWPAIIKDGKFICCRCFREFSSPKSLGGHLSKRSHCKAFDETDLSADLPTSFLDLLNSPNVLNTLQHPVASNFNSSVTFKDQPSQSLDRCPLDSRFFPNVSFPQANGSTYTGTDEQNGEVLKQVMDNPAIQNPFESPGISQAPFQSPCVSYTTDAHLPESTVIQHSGNVTVKTENEPHRQDFSKSDAESRFGSSDFSDPLLSQLLAENNSAVSLSSLPTDHLNQILRAETLMKMRVAKGDVEDPQPDGLSNDGLLAAMASLAQNLMANPLLQITSSEPCENTMTPTTTQDDTDKKTSENSIKKKLREQILAGDLRRGTLYQKPGADGNASTRNISLQNLPNDTSQSLENQQSSESSKTISVLPIGNLGAEVKSTGTIPMPSCQNDVAYPLLGQERCVSSGPLVPEASLTNNTDPCPIDSSQPEDEKVIEIQRALERLDLDKEVSENIQTVKNCSTVLNTSSNIIMKSEPQKPNVSEDEFLMKPFVCENEGCNYRAMTKDALFKHLSKTHNYTGEMISEIKKNHGKFAPFRCQMCSKTFTRNSNLRAHCQTVHSLSQEEMIKLKLKRQCNKKIEKPEISVANDHVCGNRNNIISTQIASIDYIKPEEISTRQQMSTHTRQHQTDTTQNKMCTHERSTQEYHSQASEQQPAACLAVQESPQDNSLSLQPQMQPTQSIPVSNQGVLEQAPPAIAVTRCIAENYTSNTDAFTPHQPLNVLHPSAAALPAQQLVGPSNSTGVTPFRQAVPGLPQGDPQQSGTQSLEKGPKVIKPKETKPKVESPKIKNKEKKVLAKNGEVDNTFSPYRPYRCVHQGCVAAFTIQHNLILHYKAVHQSSLPKFEVNNDEERDDQHEDLKEEQENEVVQVNEFRCQVKDCSRIFQEVTSLLQHYLQLHKFSLDKAGGLISSINLGKFQCDQADCPKFFTAFWNYIAHIEEDHKEAKISKVEAVEGLFRCEVEGCDRGYATRSNLLRHTMKKHQELYKLQLMTQRKNQDRERQASKKPQLAEDQVNDGKENMQNNQKTQQKGNDKKKNDEAKNNHWTKYGKPSLKSKEDATAMCTKKFPLQYPCMIKGCESVVSSERNIMRHYIRHGLSERYLEEQRSHFIFCKKFSRSRYKTWSARGRAKFEDSSTESSENEDVDETCHEVSETESSKPTSGRDETTEEAEMSDAKQSTDDSSETKSISSSTAKRKRGRPRKADRDDTAPLTRSRVLERLRSTRNNPVSYLSNGSDSTSSSSTVPANEEQSDQGLTLGSFKPMGFEVSFLKFLEESTQSAHAPKRRGSEDVISEVPLKRDRTIQLKTATVVCKRADAYVRPKEVLNCIDFRNPQKLTSLKNVKIVVDSAFSHVADLLLKQLQEMRPLVILQK